MTLMQYYYPQEKDMQEVIPATERTFFHSHQIGNFNFIVIDQNNLHPD